MPRVHLFELEDQPWFPPFLRDLMTDYLCFQISVFRLYEPIVSKLLDALRATGCQRLLDLCSGGAGPVLQVQESLGQAEWPVAVVLSDRFPNRAAFEQAQRTAHGELHFIDRPVDATAVPCGLDGFRTIFTAIHHFQPESVAQILADSKRRKAPIGIFDIAQRSLAMLLYTFLVVPLMVLVCTPFIRPFRWRRIFWTYFLPVVPLACWWDGIVSQLRAYSADELLDLAQREDPASIYRWEAGRVPAPLLPGGITFLIGYPTVANSRPDENSDAL